MTSQLLGADLIHFSNMARHLGASHIDSPRVAHRWVGCSTNTEHGFAIDAGGGHVRTAMCAISPESGSRTTLPLVHAALPSREWMSLTLPSELRLTLVACSDQPIQVEQIEERLHVALSDRKRLSFPAVSDGVSFDEWPSVTPSYVLDGEDFADALRLVRSTLFRGKTRVVSLRVGDASTGLMISDGRAKIVRPVKLTHGLSNGTASILQIPTETAYVVRNCLREMLSVAPDTRVVVGTSHLLAENNRGQLVAAISQAAGEQLGGRASEEEDIVRLVVSSGELGIGPRDARGIAVWVRKMTAGRPVTLVRWVVYHKFIRVGLVAASGYISISVPCKIATQDWNSQKTRVELDLDARDAAEILARLAARRSHHHLILKRGLLAVQSSAERGITYEVPATLRTHG